MAVKLQMDGRFAAKKEFFKLLKATRSLNRDALKRVADVVAKRAKAGAPVDTGLLRDSIKGKVRKVRGGEGFQASVSTNTKNRVKYGGSGKVYRRRKDGTLVKVGQGEGGDFNRKESKFGYGAAVELGRWMRTPSVMIAHGGPLWIPPQPYLRPALSESVGDIKRIYREEAAQAAVAHNRDVA